MKQVACLLAVVLIMSACKKKTFADIDLQGHRGARGLYPENTIQGMLMAVDLGVNTLEMDLAVTFDRVVILSHEPYMSSEICLHPMGVEILPSHEKRYNIFDMTYDEVRRFDCGTKEHPRFPEQQRAREVKPRLDETISIVEDYVKDKNKKPVNYNIEIKSLPEGDNLFHPDPTDFAELVFKTIDGKIEWERVTIQSFDFRVLQVFRKKYPHVKLAALVENQKSWEENIKALGFTPDIYSCYYELLTKDIVLALQKKKMKVIPWTVNERADMDRLLEWGVDGLITDYPNRTK
jgi:glycerophosphoryl diester phosphodiesterase